MEGVVSLEVEEEARIMVDEEVVPMDIVVAIHTSRDTSTHGCAMAAMHTSRHTLNTSDIGSFWILVNSCLVACFSYITSVRFSNIISVSFKSI